MDTVLVVNAGSSSLKFQIFAIDGTRDLQRLVKGQMDGVGTRPRLQAQAADGKRLIDRVYPPDQVPDLASATEATAVWLRETQKVQLVAVGHRVVHGGPDYDRPVLVDEEVLT